MGDLDKIVNTVASFSWQPLGYRQLCSARVSGPRRFGDRRSPGFRPGFAERPSVVAGSGSGELGPTAAPRTKAGDLRSGDGGSGTRAERGAAGM